MKTLKTLRFVVSRLLIAVVLFITACDKNDKDKEKGFYFDEKTFTSEWNAWEAQKIENYSFTLEGKLPYWNYTRDIPMYGYKVNIVVRNGVMESFEYIGDVPHSDVDGSILEPEFTTISGIYQGIYNGAQYQKEWWSENTDSGALLSTSYNIKYDANLHIITYFEPTSQWAPNSIVDTTAHAVKISNFTVLN